MALILKKCYFRELLNKDKREWKPNFTKFDCILLLFSIGTYLADISTDIILIIQYFKNHYTIWGICTLMLVIVPSIIVQIFSLRWYILDGIRSKVCWMVHIFNLGIFERYMKLLRCGLKAQKTQNLGDFQHFYEAQSDVCMLRLFESFMESAPQLVLQLYIMFSTEKWNMWTVISAGISLISLSWGISAYSKSMRIVRLDKQKLSLCGMFLQIIWRSGTVSCRIISMVLFASVFGSWLLLIMSLHWLVMTVWVIYQNTDFCTTWWEERLYNCIVGEIYCFCFFNLKEGHSRYRSTIFYSITFIENVAFLLSYYLIKNNGFQDDLIVGFVIFAFIIGVLSMLLYYRFFHPSGPITFNNTESENGEIISAKVISIGMENFLENVDDCFSKKSISETNNRLSSSILCKNVTLREDKILSYSHKFQKDTNSISNIYNCYQENHQSHSQNCSVLTIHQDPSLEDSLIMNMHLKKQLASHHKLVNYNFRTQASFRNLYDSQIHCSCLVLMDNDHSSNELKVRPFHVGRDFCYSLPNLNLSLDYQNEESYFVSPSDAYSNRTWSLCNLYKSELANCSIDELNNSILTKNETSNKRSANKEKCKCNFLLPTSVSCRCSRKFKKCIEDEILKSEYKTCKDINNTLNNINNSTPLKGNNCNIFNSEQNNNNSRKSKITEEQEAKNKFNLKIADNPVQNFHSSEIFQKVESNSSIPTLSKVCIVWNDANLH
ncbi:uncharacterized protein [Centruroides vittatus]|uniref:uncharacterized protein n=1 Tax=Centruroides vittatus TaxID=120091 RepID=UPI003510AABA